MAWSRCPPHTTNKHDLLLRAATTGGGSASPIIIRTLPTTSRRWGWLHHQRSRACSSTAAPLLAHVSSAAAPTDERRSSVRRGLLGPTHHPPQTLLQRVAQGEGEGRDVAWSPPPSSVPHSHLLLRRPAACCLHVLCHLLSRRHHGVLLHTSPSTGRPLPIGEPASFRLIARRRLPDFSPQSRPYHLRPTERLMTQLSGRRTCWQATASAVLFQWRHTHRMWSGSCSFTERA